MRVRARLDLLADRKGVYCFLLAKLAGRRTVDDLVVAGERLVSALGVSENHLVLAVLVREVVVDALLLHQSTDKVEVRLAVLYAVFPRAMRTGEPILKIRETVVAEHLLDDVRDGHLLEHPAVARSRQQPQPGRLVLRQPAAGADLGELADDSVEISWLVVFGLLQANRHVLADDAAEVDVRLRTEQVQNHFKRPAHPLGEREAPQ